MNLAAWLHPVLYLIAFLPHVAPNWMPDKLDSAFEVFIYIGLMFGDVIILIVMMNHFDKLEKVLPQRKPVDSSSIGALN